MEFKWYTDIKIITGTLIDEKFNKLDVLRNVFGLEVIEDRCIDGGFEYNPRRHLMNFALYSVYLDLKIIIKAKKFIKENSIFTSGEMDDKILDRVNLDW